MPKRVTVQDAQLILQLHYWWGMVAAFVSQGTLSESVFWEQTFSGEMFIIYAKVRPS